MGKKKIIIGLIVLVVVLLAIKANQVLNDRKEAIENTPLAHSTSLNVPVLSTTQGTLVQKSSFLAQVLSDKSITLSTKLAGYVEKVYVQEAQKVKKGELLLEIDADEIHSNIQTLQNTLHVQERDVLLAKSIHERNKKLYKVGGLAKEKRDTSALNLSMKQATRNNTKEKITQLEHQLSYVQIKAPFDGVVDTLLVHEGDLAMGGKAMLRMSNGDMKLLFSYASTQKGKIKEGLRVYIDAKYVGEIKSLYSVAKNGLLQAEVTLDNAKNLTVGEQVNIEVHTQKAQGCIVPSNTLVHQKQSTFVMAYKDGSFFEQEVNIVIETEGKALLSECPDAKIAYGSEVKLALLPSYKSVQVVEKNVQ